MRAVIDSKPWKKDPLAVNKHWDESAYALKEHNGGRQLVFGIIWNDGNVVPHPPVIRGLEMTRDALLKAGHKGLRCTNSCWYKIDDSFVLFSCRVGSLQA